MRIDRNQKRGNKRNIKKMTEYIEKKDRREGCEYREANIIEKIKELTYTYSSESER